MKKEALHHPKMHALATILKVPIYAAVGIMESLWTWTAQYAPTGRLHEEDQDAAAHFMGWRKSPGTLFNALDAAGWLDGPAGLGPDQTDIVLVHDWSEHAPDAAHITLAMRGEVFADGTPPNPRKASQHQRARIEERRCKQDQAANERQLSGTNSADVTAARAAKFPPSPSPSPSPSEEEDPPSASRTFGKTSQPPPLPPAWSAAINAGLARTAAGGGP